MRFSRAAVLALAATKTVVDAAPAPALGENKATELAKKEDLVKALNEYSELQAMRAKRDVLTAELTAREYTIVTNVLTAIKDASLAPVVLKFFVRNSTLSNIAINGVVLVIKSGLISAKNLLSLLVQSGLITSVLNDLLGNCEVYKSLFSVAGSLLKSLFKRDEDSARRDLFTPEEGMELLRREGLMEPAEFHDIDLVSLEARDIDNVIVNLLESLASSGLATQVVETVLTDSQFLAFGAKLVQTLYSDGLLKLSSLVSAIAQSGIVPALLKELLNFNTLTTFARTAVSAATGKCTPNSNVTTPTRTTLIPIATGTALNQKSGTALIATSSSSRAVATATTSSSPLLGLASSLLGGGNVLSNVNGLLNNFFGDGKASTAKTTTTTSSTRTSASTSTVRTISTSVAKSFDPCATPISLLQRRRMRLY